MKTIGVTVSVPAAAELTLKTLYEGNEELAARHPDEAVIVAGTAGMPPALHIFLTVEHLRKLQTAIGKFLEER